MLFSQLRKKQVVNLATGACLGQVTDLVFDDMTGVVRAIIVPDIKTGFLAHLKPREDLMIPYKCIETIGNYVILARVDSYATLDEEKRK